MKQLFTGLLILFSLFSFSQETPEWGWAQKAGGSGHEEGRKLVSDSEGNMYVVATVSSSIQLGNGITVANGQGNTFSTYVAKYSPSGTVLWAKVFQSVLNITTDADDNLYIIGQYLNTMTLGSYTISHQETVPQAYIAKYSPSGEVLWLQQKGDIYTVITAMAKMDGGTMIIAGVSWDDTVDGTYIYRKSWIGKTDTGTGMISQVKPLLGECDTPYCNNDLRNLYVDSQHNVYLYGLLPTDIITESWQMQGTGKTYLAKFNADLDFQWSRIMDSSGMISVTSVTDDNEGNIYFAGILDSNDTVTVDPTNVFHTPVFGITHVGELMGKFTTDGELQWHRIRLGVVTNVIRNRLLARDAFGNVYLSGTFNGQLDFDGTVITATSSSNLFVSRIDADGNYLWVKHSTGAGTSFLCGMAEDKKGSIYINGYTMFAGQTFGDTALGITTPMISNPYAADSYIAKLGSCDPSIPQIVTETLQMCNNSPVTLEAPEGAQYLWSSGETTQSIEVTEAGDYTVTVANSVGCYKNSEPVSVTEINIDNSITLNGNTVTANTAGATYQWGICDGGDFEPLDGATAQSFTPQGDGNYAVEITSGNCTTLSECIAVETLGINPMLKEGIYLYPNPNKGMFTIALPNTIAYAVFTIFDITGRKVYGSTLSGGNNIVSQKLQAGSYYIEIETGGITKTVKMIVE